LKKIQIILVFSLILVPFLFDQCFGQNIFTINIPEGAGEKNSSIHWIVTSSNNLQGQITIAKGQSIIWNNQDSAEHTITSGNPEIGFNGIFDSGVLLPGKSFEFEFNESGEFSYYCIIHPWMIGKIVVAEPYLGKNQVIKNIGTQFFKSGEGIDVSYILEGKLSDDVLINPEQNSITFYYDPLESNEDVLIIKLPEKLINDIQFTEVNGKKISDAIRQNIDDVTTMYVPLWPDSKEITFTGTQVVSGISEKKENIIEKGVEGAKDIVKKGKEIGQTIIDSETERHQEIDQKRLETKEAVEEKGSEAIQDIGEVAGGGCLIATATYGSELAPQVQKLREIRDTKLLNSKVGSSFMKGFNEFYYSFSPAIADYERENPIFREGVNLAITPLIASLSILNVVDMDSELEVLGYGISLILLNIGMYVAVPAVGIREIKKNWKKLG
jgi:hypothetical protein